MTLRAKQSSDILAWVIVPLALLLGPVLLAFGVRDLYYCATSTRWPLTEGRIIASETTQRQSKDSNGDGTTVYDAAITFEYWVGETRYVSDRIRGARLGASSLQRYADRLVRRYPTGMLVRPAYNPKAPMWAVLEPGVHVADLFMLYMGIPLSLMSAYVVRPLFRKRKSRHGGMPAGERTADSWKPGKLAFLRGFSQGVESPDGRYTATFGTRSANKPGAQPGTAYECSVEMDVPDGSLVLFTAIIDQSQALPDLRQKKDVVTWDEGSATVTFRGDRATHRCEGEEAGRTTSACNEGGDWGLTTTSGRGFSPWLAAA